MAAPNPVFPPAGRRFSSSALLLLSVSSSVVVPCLRPLAACRHDKAQGP